MIIDFIGLDKLIASLDYPQTLVVHKDDYLSIVAKFAAPGLRGHDEYGEYLMFLTTKIRPNPPIHRPEIVDISDVKRGWN